MKGFARRFLALDLSLFLPAGAGQDHRDAPGFRRRDLLGPAYDAGRSDLRPTGGGTWWFVFRKRKGEDAP